MLQATITPNINEIIKAINISARSSASTLFVREVRYFLYETYLGGYIGPRGPKGLPAQLPDLTSLDYFLWEYVHSIVLKRFVGRRLIEVCSEIRL